MAKRRSFNRRKRSSKKSNDSINSRLLDTNTGMGEGFNEIEHRNETPQLNPNSELVSDPNTSQWWKHLESSNSESTSIRARPENLSAVIVRANVLETSASESEKEQSLRKKKIQLRVPSRKSNSNAFLDILNNTEESMPLKLRMKQRKYSNLYNKSDGEVLEKKVDESNEYNSSPSPNILKIKPSIFKKSKGGTNNQNPFEDIVTKNDSSNVKSKSVTFEKKSNHSIYQNINTSKDRTNQDINTSKDRTNQDINTSKNHIDQIKTTQLSQTLPLENNEAGPSNSSISTAMFENNVTPDINKTIETSDDSHIKVSNRKRFKFKSYLIKQSSMDTNPFKNALAENRDTSLSEHNKDKEIDIRDVRSPLKTKSLSSPSKKIVNRLEKKTDVTHENVLTSSPIRRSPRSLKTVKKPSLDISAQIQDNVQDTSNSSLDNDEFHIKKPAYLKLKSKILSPYKRSLTNPFKEILMEDGNINARKSNIAIPTKDNHISVEQDKITTEISQGHEQVIMKRYSQSTRHVSEDSETFFKISSNNVQDVSENPNVQSKKKNKLSENNDVNISKSISQRIIMSEDKSKISQNKKQISFSRNSIRDISGISKEHINVTSTDGTKISEMKTRKTRSEKDKSFTQDASSTSNVRNLLTSQIVNAENFEKIRAEVDRLKTREMAMMKMADEKKESAKTTKVLGATRKLTKKKNPPKIVDKAYLVNGKVYKPPRLPRPKHWATDHLYKFLWKHMEPKYQLSTRVRSEKFVLLLAKIISIIERRKKYENYKLELETLMKEMARLNIISTRNDFYHFCQDFLPHGFRIKVIPMLLPGNKQNIPFEPEKLHIPLLKET